MQTTTTRRAIRAGLSVVHTGARGRGAEPISALDAAIVQHHDAVAGFLAAEVVSDADQVRIPAMNAMWDALETVMAAPCRSEAEFARKTRYVLTQFERFYGPGEHHENDGYLVAMLRQRLVEIAWGVRS